jgi:BolA protein
MKGVASKETHFQCVRTTSAYESWTNKVVSVTITSDAFESKMQPARHRMVYALLKEEMSREGGIHALQLKTKTPAEETREKEREAQA